MLNIIRRQPYLSVMNSQLARVFVAAALVAALGIATAASAQEVQSPLSVLDRMFGRTERSTPPETAGQGEQGSATDQVVRIEQLEEQIRRLTGTVEQLQYRNQQLESQLRRYQGVAGALPSQSARPSGPGAPTSAPMSAPMAPSQQQSGRRSDVFDPSQHPNAPGVPRTLGSMPSEPPPVVTAEPPVGVPGGRGTGAPLDLSTLATGIPQVTSSAPGQPPDNGALPPPPSRNLSATGAVASVAPPSETPKDYYDLAYGYVLRKDYALAERAFETFLKKYPSDRRVADAEYWLGESHFQRQRYDAAAQAFLDLSTKHKSHGKAPDALLRLGQSLAALKQKEMACATFAEVGRKYPRASNSVKQGVEREQKRVHC
jgi:tol-pal system protein YbgF